MIIGIDASRAFISDKTGTENYSFHVITQMLQLPESNKHTFVLFIRPNAVLPSELERYDNVIVKKINYRWLWTQIGLAWETWKEPRLDVLWIPAHTLPVLRRPGIQTVVTIHGLEYQWLKEYKNILQRWYLPLSTYYAAKAATGIIAVSKFTAKQLQKETHIDNKRIKVVHEGTELHSRSVGALHSGSVWDKYGLQKYKYVLFVGSIQPRKNLVELIAAFSTFAGSNPDYKLVIAGGAGWDSAEIYSAPMQYGVEEKVVFTGRVTDAELQALYLGAWLYTQSSITEGFGLPVLEAMSYDVPVITSDGGALSEIVGDDAIVIPLGYQFVKQLASAMTKIVHNPNLRKSMIVKGKGRIASYTWQKTARLTLDYLVTTGQNIL